MTEDWDDLYVSDPLADMLIEQYPQFDFDDIGDGVIFYLPNNKEADDFKRVVRKLKKSKKWRVAKAKKKQVKMEKRLPVKTQTFERTGICPTCGITISAYREMGCGIAHLPIQFCPGSQLPSKD